METFSALLAICAGNSPVPGEFPTQRPVTRSFNVFFELRKLSKQLWGWWFETLCCLLWRIRSNIVSLVVISALSSSLSSSSSSFSSCHHPIIINQSINQLLIDCQGISSLSQSQGKVREFCCKLGNCVICYQSQERVREFRLWSPSMHIFHCLANDICTRTNFSIMSSFKYHSPNDFF